MPRPWLWLSALTFSILSGCTRVPEGTILLPASQGPKLAKPCSRPSFKADRFWQVTPVQAAAFDHALRALLASPRSHDLFNMVGSLSHYRRQLIGYTINDRQYIYANFYPGDDMKTPWIGPILLASEPAKAMDVCDGGHRYWGATQDLQTETIRSVDNNGAIGLPSCHWDFSKEQFPTERSACGL